MKDVLLQEVYRLQQGNNEEDTLSQRMIIGNIAFYGTKGDRKRFSQQADKVKACDKR